MKALKIIITLLLFVGISTTCTNVNKKPEHILKITDKLEELVEINEVPGLNFSIIYKDGKQENYSAGYAFVDKKIHMIPEFVMFSGSIGKTYAVAVLMQLVDEDKVDLDEKFINYFPNHEWLERLPNINDFTIRNLLEHTSGLPRWIFKPGPFKAVAENPDKVWTDKDRLQFVFDDEPLHETGKSWDYSDTNYLLIGMLIEKITGNYFYDEVRDRVLKPYQLKYTYPSIRRIIPNIAQGYSKLTVFGMPETVVNDGKYVFNPQMEWTGGGFYSTTDDLAKWAKIFYASDIFSDKMKEEIVKINPNGKAIGSEETSYGMGSFIYHTKHGDMYGHGGTFPGFKSIFAYHPEEGIAYALQVNCDYADEKMSLLHYLTDIIDVIKEE